MLGKWSDEDRMIVSVIGLKLCDLPVMKIFHRWEQSYVTQFVSTAFGRMEVNILSAPLQMMWRVMCTTDGWIKDLMPTQCDKYRGKQRKKWDAQRIDDASQLSDDNKATKLPLYNQSGAVYIWSF